MSDNEVSRQFEPFFKAWYPHLLRYTGRFAPCRATAEDVVQDVFLDLYKALRSGQTIDFPKAWTLRVARRKCAELRSRPFDLDQSHESLETLEALGNGGEHPAGALHANVDIERLRGSLSVLTEREEQVLLLRLDAMKFREIGASLGITTSSVNTLLVRALDRLQRAFGVRQTGTAARRRHEI
jgi:RNA polymerase sigma-70 factor, ECF subfamily